LTLVDVASLFLAGLLGMVVAGNNLSSCSGTVIGSNMVSRRFGILIAISGYLLGLFLEGPKLFRVREVFLPMETGTQVLAILMASFLVFLGGELSRTPLSLSKAMTGAILGVSVASGSVPDTRYLVLILSFWFLAPLLATGLGVLFVDLDHHYSPKNLWRKLAVLKAGLLVVAFLSAYMIGSNSLGLIAGVLYNQTQVAEFAIGLGSIIGAFTFGRGALRRLSEGIYSLRYPNAFYSQLLGAGTVELANQLGIPLSTTETVSSGIIGSGFATKMRVMNVRNITVIITGWIVSPVVGALLGYALTRLLG
jgi:inorganic phosphate transporter, PiT family